MTDLPEQPGLEEAGPEAGAADDASTPNPTPEGTQTYEAAVARLEEIIRRLDTGKAELRETLELVREGKRLVEFCKGELDAVSGELEALDLDALVDQLESRGAEG